MLPTAKGVKAPLNMFDLFFVSLPLIQYIPFPVTTGAKKGRGNTIGVHFVRRVMPGV